VGEGWAAWKMKIVARSGFVFVSAAKKSHYLFYQLFLTLQKNILHIS
jgi:hypothetical protein